jgi:glycosyltransferase involved in cell wall biosynthesis
VSGPVIYLVRSWPRLSQTFIVNEILALERRGVDLVLFSLVRSGESIIQPQVNDVRTAVRYLEDRESLRRRVGEHVAVFLGSPLRYLKATLFALRRRDLSKGYATATTWQCFRYAVRVAAAVVGLRRAGTAPAHLHAHFAHDPALVALLVRRLTGLTYSFTAHARDLVQIPPSSLEARAAEATALVTCCQVNADYIAEAVPERVSAVRVIRHGVELDSFTPGPRAAGVADAVTDARIVTVGRLVEKKGFPDLLQALGRLQASRRRVTCDVYGDGPLLGPLTELRESLGLSDAVRFAGEQSRETIIQALRRANIFVLTPTVTSDGDRDGIPNVLVEAMACGLPVVTTSAGGIAELVTHGENGFLTAPGDVAGIENYIALLLDSPELRRQMGVAARHTVESGYDVNLAAEQLHSIFLFERTVKAAS